MADARDNFIPWGLRPLQDFVFKELEHRSKSYDIDYTSLDNYDDQEYNGPRTAWVRVCSNGKIPTDSEQRRNPPKPNDLSSGSFREGFIMYGVNGFNDTYGIDDLNNQSKVVLGYDVKGDKHVLDDSENQTFQNRPGPGVTSIESEFYGAGASFNGLCRKVTIKWRANSIDQLNYMMPYFLSPMMTVVVEWGWNVYNPDSLIDLTDTGVPADPENNITGSGLIGYYTNSQLLQKRIEKSNGNYDAFIGRIYNFNFALTRDGGYECTTVLVNTNYMLGGLFTKKDSSVRKDGTTEKPAEILDFENFVKNSLDKIFDKRNEGKSWVDRFKEFFKSPSTDVEGTTAITEDLKKIFEKAKNEEKLFSKEIAKKNTGTDQPENLTKNYLKFDVFIELVNYFYSKQFNAGRKKIPVAYFDIKDAKVCAYPLIKSISDDVLIPNKHAPKFWSKNGISGISGISQNEIKTVVGGEYGKLLYKLGEKVIKSAIEEEDDVELYYDDLNFILNGGEVGREFPQVTGTGGPPGYFGYLKDIYISTQLIRDELEANDKYEQFLIAILARINNACNDIFKFKITPYDPNDNVRLTIIDENYFDSIDDELKKITESPGIVIGSTNSSFILNASLDVNLTSQVSAQTLFGNAVYDYRSKRGKKTEAVRNGPGALFVYTDRLFDNIAETAVIETSPTSIEKLTNTETNIKDFLHVMITKPVSQSDIAAAERSLIRIRDLLKKEREKRDETNKKLTDEFGAPLTGRLTEGIVVAQRPPADDPRRSRFDELKNEENILLNNIRILDQRKKNIEDEIRLLRGATTERSFSGAEGGINLDATIPATNSRPVSVILKENDESVQQLFKNVVLTDDDGDIVKNNMYIYNTIMPDTELSLEFLGIAGLRYLDTFTIDGVAEPYTHKKAIWQVDKVNSVVSGNSWKTVVVAKVRPHSFFAKNNKSVVASRPEPTPSSRRVVVEVFDLERITPTDENP